MGFRRLALAMFRQDLDWLGLTFYTPTQVELVYNYINQLWFLYIGIPWYHPQMAYDW